MEEHIPQIEAVAKKTWPVVMAWIGGITAVIGFVASIAGGVTWLINHHRHSVEYSAKLALAQTQAKQEQYQAAMATYAEILKDDPLNGRVLDAQLDTAMLWVENFSAYGLEGKDEQEQPGSALDTVLPVLTAGLSRAKQARVADVEAHLGWAHFLNAKMTQREDDSVAVSDWRGALSTDPKNVYANAMLGNWILQSYGDFQEAVDHFHTAIRTGRARPFVRQLQVGGLLYLDLSGARAEMIRVADEMRKGGEELDPGERHRISNWCFDPVITNHKELSEALGALPTDDAWQTYLWLERSDESGSQEERDLKNEFIHANLLELSGNRDAALSEFRKIHDELRDRPGALQEQVEAGIKRLTRS